MMVEVRSVYDNQVVMATKRSKSNVWQFFEKIEEKISRCRLCLQECRTGGNTSNLWDHFKRKHTMVFVDNAENEAVVPVQIIENICRVREESEHTDDYPKPVRKKPRKTIVCSDKDELKDKKIIPLPGGRSEVWKQKLFGFYSNDGKTIVDKQRAVCTLCFSEIPYSGNTTNLGIHLAKKHPDHYHKMKTELEEMKSDGEEASPKQQQQQMMAVSSAVSMMPRGGFRAVNISEAVASFLIRDVHSLGVATDEGFRQLLNVLEPRYEALDPRQLNEVLLKRKAAITEVLRDKLNEVDACSMIADCWSADDQRNYCTLMVRFIDDDWQVQNYVLQTIEMSEQVLWDVNKVLADWGVMPRISQQASENPDVETYLTIETSPVKIVASVTNESNYVLEAIRSLCATTGTPNLPCFINVVNHAVNAAMTSEVVSEIVGKARRLVSHFTGTVKDQLLEEEASADFVQQLHELTLDLNGRWPATTLMLEKLLLFLINPITAAFLDGEEEAARKLRLTPDERQQLEILHNALNGFSVAIGVLGSEDAACSMVTPLLHRQKEKLSKINEREATAVFNLVKTLWENLDPHYSDKEVQSFLNLATFLDPRFKELVDLSEEAKQEVQQTFRALIEQEAQQSLIITLKEEEEEDDGEEVPAKRARQRMQELDLLFGSIEDGKELHGSVVNGSDMDRYLQEKSVYIKESPLGWWSKNWQRFPLLAKLAKRYLCAPATAVPSTFVLAPEGSLFHNRRRRLLPEEVDLMIFLNKNLSLIC